MRSNVLTLFKTKALVLVVAAALVIGGATVVFAASSSSQNVVHTFSHSNPTGTVTPGHKSDSDQNDDQDSQEHGKNCDNGDGTGHPTATATPHDEKDSEGSGKECDDGSDPGHPTPTSHGD